MPKFLAVYYQRGGCDYTIGCGIIVEPLTAESPTDARERVLSELADVDERTTQWSTDEINSLERVRIYALAEDAPVGISGQEIVIRRLKSATETQRAQTEQQERSELERLSKKYNK